jgi:hypothetical protein
LNEIRSALTVAEYNLTGMATKPNEMVRDAIDRALMGMAGSCRIRPI